MSRPRRKLGRAALAGPVSLLACVSAMALLLPAAAFAQRELTGGGTHPLLAGVGRVVPTVRIDTGGVELVEKKEWVTATVTVDGAGVYPDYEGTARVRGRGNSTWDLGLQFGKKPYRIKLDEPAPLLGLASERNWILLANFIDVSLMQNAVAFAVGRLLEVPFTHHMIPTDVYFNGEYVGSYVFTEHKDVTPNRIAVGEGGVLLELDTYYDEEFEFRSTYHDLPVMIQHPKLADVSEDEADEVMTRLLEEFTDLEFALKEPLLSEWMVSQLLDPTSFAKFLIVFYVTNNQEINYPKSVYMHRLAEGPYRMGPIWDFDWAFGYDRVGKEPFVNPTDPLLDPAEPGGYFFQAIADLPEFQEALQLEWRAFRDELYPVLLEYVRLYALTIADSAERDYELWHDTEWQVARPPTLEGQADRIIDWLEERVRYLDGVVGLP